jgi:glycosyltransferase involved in cell wall biosynthesis
MKICILGAYSGRLDEGMLNVSHNVYKNLHSIIYPNNLFELNVQGVYGITFWKDILAIRPDIIHYFQGPTLKGLILVKLIQLITRSRSVISATKPVIPTKYFRIISFLFKPDVVIVQSKKSENLFENIKYKTTFVPNGVDTDRFTTVSYEKKLELRNRYGFDEKDFIILHVGPLRNGRNQKALLELIDVKVLLVVSITNPSEELIYQELIKTKKAIIWKEYFSNIEDIYSIADVYVFPVFEEQNSIEIPLSVLEAMSCNLPVITTRYGALERILQEGEGLFFIDKQEQIPQLINEIKDGKYKINTRRKIQHLSWKNIVNEIYLVYQRISDGRNIRKGVRIK